MATPRFAWGIDVGNRALKAIKLARDGDTIRIEDFDVIEHEQILSQAGDNRETLLQTALATFAQKHSAKGAAVAIGVSGQASFARFIKLPPVDPSKIPEIVKFEAIQQIPFPLNDVEWSYQLFQAKDSPEVEVGIFAMRRDLVNQTIQNFSDVGVEVTTVQMNPLAVYNGLYFDDRIEGTTMIVDVGAENSDLIIAEGENIWMRSIPIGGNNFTEALVKAFKLKFPKAEELKRNAATSKYGRQILQAMKPVFSDLVGEIQRSIGFYSSTHRESRIVKVMALGGTFRLPGLQKYLQQNLQLDVVRMDRLNAAAPADAKFAAEFNENILSSIAAYGLALQAMGQGKITSSLLPEKIKRERMWKEKTPWFAAAAALFVVGTGIAFGRLYTDQMAFANQEPVRNQIKVIAQHGKSFDGRWKSDVESSGADDRLLITNFLSLLNDRDLVLKVTSEIGKAIPPTNSKELVKPRPQRQIVELSSWSMRYEPDLAAILAMSEDDFNKQIDKTDTMVNGGGIQGFRAVSSRVHGGPGVMPSAAPAPNPSAAGPAQRGYMLTIVCRTSVSNPTQLVTSTVAQALRGRNQKAADAPQGFSIERVTIPSTMLMSTAYASGTLATPRAPLVFTPPGANGAGGGNQVLPTNPVYQPNPGGARVIPYGARGADPRGMINGLPRGNTPAGAPAPAELFPDPVHPGESARDDSLVTVLAAVVIDPAPLKTDQAKADPTSDSLR